MPKIPGKDSVGVRGPKSRNAVIVRLTVVLLVLFCISLIVGPVDISLGEIFSSIISGFRQDNGEFHNGMVFWFVRLPRCLLTVLVGAGLSVSGAVYQGLFRNPLVSPDILGVSAGATFGAALGLLLPGANLALIHVLAFFFEMVAVFMALAIAQFVAVRPLLVLVLAGFIVLSLFNSSITITKFLADPYNELPAIIFWIMGSMSRADWPAVITVGVVTLVGLVFFHILRYRLNVLSLGDLQSQYPLG
ncbi:MAG: iron ABC transporter permease [Deltaproteobacteria bacterium]|nr:iron ABC transporter permease [Deltaproteobacteria bacterium]